MKKAWFILVSACILFLGIRFYIPKETIHSYFETETGNQFENLLNEQLQDTISQKRIKDSLALIKEQENKILTENEIRKADSIKKIIEYKRVNRKGLSQFFEKLYALENNKNEQIRIAFFGDSMEDADMIVMQFRNFLQTRFGGQGVGYVPITSVTAKGRYSVKHKFSRGWKVSNFMKKGYGKFLFGLNGKTFYVGKDTIQRQASVTYRKGNAYNNLPLINPTLFYGRAKVKDSLYKGVSAYYSSRSKTDTLKLQPTKLLNTINLPNLASRFTVTVKDQNTTPFYGVSFASKNGVIVDNLSVRGNSGLPLGKLNSSLMQQFDKQLNYDLVIVAYGTNAFSFKTTKYGWYKRNMIKNIKHIQECFPNADILVSSMGDRSTKIDGVMKTPEHLPNFINTQYQIAQESNAGFYNLYNEMGGKDSMVKWVETYHLAGDDYTHFSPKGAVKAGKMLYNWLMKEYNEQKKGIKLNNTTESISQTKDTSN